MKGSTFGINAEIAAASRASLSSAPQVTDEAVEAAKTDIKEMIRLRDTRSPSVNQMNSWLRVLEQFAASAPAVSGEPVAWAFQYADFRSDERGWYGWRDCFALAVPDVTSPERIRNRIPLYAAPSAPVEDAVKAEREALRACVPILEGLIAAEYNVETWGVKGRLAAVLAALDRARKP